MVSAVQCTAGHEPSLGPHHLGPAVVKRQWLCLLTILCLLCAYRPDDLDPVVVQQQMLQMRRRGGGQGSLS